MGGCNSANAKDENNEESLILSPREIDIIRNNWGIVVKEGLEKYGTNMMIRFDIVDYFYFMINFKCIKFKIQMIIGLYRIFYIKFI